MTDVLDRMIRVREIRAAQALAELGRAQARVNAEAALLARVSTLRIGQYQGVAAAGAVKARARADVMLGKLAGDIADRLANNTAFAAEQAQSLARARAAVDAAIARRAEREELP